MGGAQRVKEEGFCSCHQKIRSRTSPTTFPGLTCTRRFQTILLRFVHTLDTHGFSSPDQQQVCNVVMDAFPWLGRVTMVNKYLGHVLVIVTTAAVVHFRDIL